MKKFRYRTSFSSDGAVARKVDREFFAESSLAPLKSLFPSKEDMDANDDLLYVAFNIGVANLVNSNDDAVMTESALAGTKFWKDKQLNIEHMRSFVVGHVINTGFSKFGSNEIVTAEDLRDTNDPFNMSLAGVVYKVVDPYFVEMLEEDQSISTSWEIGFDDYVIAKGSKNLKEAEIISAEHSKEFENFLRCNGGTGFTDDGVEVYRVVVGDWKPLGGGFTGSPAGAVRGIVTAALVENSDVKTILRDLVKEEIIISSNQEEPTLVNDKKNISQIKTSTVKKNSMKLKSIDDIQQDKLQEMEASEIRDFIRTQLQEAVSGHQSEKEAVESEKEQLAAEKQQVDATLASTQSELTKAQAEIDNLKNEISQLKSTIEASAKEALFNEHMSVLDEQYSLSKEEKEVVARQIKDLDADAFASWKKDFDVFNASKVKGSSNEENEPKEALKTAVASKQTPVPSTSSASEDKLSKLRESFKNVKVIVR